MITTLCRISKSLLHVTLSKHGGRVLAGSYSTGSQAEYSDSEQRKFLASLPGSGGKVKLSKDNARGIATVTISNPDIHNALNGSMMVELRDIVDELVTWKQGKGVIVHGEGGTFCSGGDLKFMNSVFSVPLGVGMSRYMQTTLNRLYNLPLISLAVLEGNTLGGGSELALACDFRVAAPGARFGFVQVRMGVAPGWGGGAKLVHAVGRARALDILTSGKVFTAEEALDAGMLQHVLSDGDDVMMGARAWLEKRLFQDASVVRALKRIVVNGSPRLDEDVMMEERSAFGTVWSGKAHAQAIENNIKHK